MGRGLRYLIRDVGSAAVEDNDRGRRGAIAVDAYGPQLPPTPGGRLHTILPRMCGLKFEGNGSFLDQEGGKRSPAIWVYFRGFTPVLVCL